MKKKLIDFVNKSTELAEGQIRGGFTAIRGGHSIEEFGTNRAGGCTNDGSCTSTNASSCDNNGDCSKTTNNLNCDNTRTCYY